jgi:fucose 4-O-acetylase-like acetyltransferase
MTQRISWVDIFRGLAIVAIVIGHSGSPIQIYHLVYSFHIAAFLFISGYTFNSQKDLITLVIDRTKRLLVPYFSYNLLFFSLYIILEHFNVETFFYGSKATEFWSYLELIFWAPLAGMGWFLWTLFETTICAAIFIKVLQKYRISYLLLCLPMIALFFLGVSVSYPLDYPNFFLTPAFDINLTTIPYFLLGFLAQHYKIFDRKQLLLYSTPILMLAIYLLAWRHNADINFIFRDLGHWPYAIPASFAAFGCLFSFSVLAETFGWLRRLLVFIGKRTLPIMCLHLLGFKIVSLISYAIGVCPVAFVSNSLLPRTEYFWIALTVLSICFCLVLSKLLEKNRYLSFLFLGSSPTLNVRTKDTKILVSLVLLLYASIFIYSWNKGYFDYTGLNMMIATAIHGNNFLQTEPPKLALYVRLGNLHYHLGDYDEAINNYQKAISIQPKNIKAMFGLALVYSALHDSTNALNVLRIMRQIEPDNPDICYNIACIYAKQNMTDKSIEWLKLSIEKGFHNWDLIKKDPDLASIRKTAFINELIKNH